ncbi:hypothetical protein PRZ48_011760 [Zasmidium cellare]|uniref:Uncharacterized protein n=1 Tax=Zasmidium cellare TaxID=395010 RepID=A0ABR0E7G8_ZASCE|nr:hypothetical protein PRZ48_011760 [Zasmidium cellare]
MPPEPDNVSLDAKPENDPEPFRLLDLPPELWVKIGKYAIDDAPKVTEQNFLEASDIKHSEWASVKEARAALIQPAITKICQVMRNELLPYYYQAKFHVVFNTLADHLIYDVFAEWLSAGGGKYLRYFQSGLWAELVQGGPSKLRMKTRIRQWVVPVKLEETGRFWHQKHCWCSTPMPMAEYRIKLE